MRTDFGHPVVDGLRLSIEVVGPASTTWQRLGRGRRMPAERLFDKSTALDFARQWIDVTERKHSC
jgi:hypothetical protein